MPKITPHNIVKPSVKQRVLFCGDVHGEYKTLSRGLDKVGFQSAKDILIFTGDLIDRGPESAKVINFATCTPGVYSVVGNHEVLFLAALHDPFCRVIHSSEKYGGSWTDQTSQTELEALGVLIQSSMSIAISVESPSYRIGVVHAAAPDDWCDIETASPENIDLWISSRKQFEDAFSGKEHVVAGVDAVVHGHVVHEVFGSGNHLWIDTLYPSGELTIIEASQVIDRIKFANDLNEKTLFSGV